MNFIDLLYSGQTFGFHSLPETLLSHFNNFGITNVTNHFYYLKLKQCKSEGFVVEISAVAAQSSSELICHKFVHMGYFEEKVFHRFEMENKLLCYYNNSCAQVNTKECLIHFSNFNCTTKSFSPCMCEPNETSKCKIVSEMAQNNFVFMQSRPEFLAVSTNSKVYTIIQNQQSVTKSVPSNGILIIVLNEADTLLVGDMTVHGTAKVATYIPHFIVDDFTLPPFPATVTPFNFDYDSFKSDYGFEIVLVLNVVVILIILIIYKICC